jgi:hypothetical protein
MNLPDSTHNPSAESSLSSPAPVVPNPPGADAGALRMRQPESPLCEDTPGTSAALIASAGLALSAVLASCKKEDNLLFELQPVELYSSAAEKDKLKSNEQFISILYTNLFQQALSSNQVFAINQCLESIGDKELAREVLISNFFNDDGVIMPSTGEMNADLDVFIDNSYKRFFVRLPTVAERTWLRNFIENNPYMTPELVYFSFALSNEYLYY